MGHSIILLARHVLVGFTWLSVLERREEIRCQDRTGRELQGQGREEQEGDSYIVALYQSYRLPNTKIDPKVTKSASRLLTARQDMVAWDGCDRNTDMRDR